MKATLIAIVLYLMLPFYSLSNPAVTSISFQLTRNLIMVQASVNGKEGLFILDTGVSEIILNNRYFNGEPTGDKFYGISGSEMEKEVQFIKFDIGGFEKQLFAIVADFTALEKVSGLELFGVVGNSIFKNCEVVLDYTFKELTIYQLDKKGNRFSSKNIHQRPMDTLSFIVGKGVPYVEVNANGQRLKMSVDSGASANVMDIEGIDHMNLSFSKVMKGSMASFGPEIVPVKSQIIDKMVVGKLLCPPMKTLFINLDHLNKSHSGKKVDGILGYEFLSNFRVAINFRKKEIYLWDRESVEQQWALASLNNGNK